MSHLAKIVIGAVVVGAVLGVIVVGVAMGLEDMLVDMQGHLRRRPRGALMVPPLLGAAAGWIAMKGLERVSGIGGAAIICGLALLSGGAAVGVAAGIGSGVFQRMSDEQLLIIATLAAAGFVAMATGMAWMDE